MLPRDVVREALERVRAVWPSLPVTSATVDAYADAVAGFAPDVIAAGARLVIQRHEGAAPPKPAQLRAACGDARKMRGGGAGITPREHDAQGCEVKCGQCQTVTLYHELAADGTFGRLFPWHLDGCPLRRADQPTDAASARLVWPQRGNGGRYRAPVTALVQETARRFPAA